MDMQPWETEEQYKKARWICSHERSDHHARWEGRAQNNGMDSEAIDTHTRHSQGVGMVKKGKAQDWDFTYQAERREARALWFWQSPISWFPLLSLRDSDKGQAAFYNSYRLRQKSKDSLALADQVAHREKIRWVSSAHTRRCGTQLLEQFCL